MSEAAIIQIINLALYAPELAMKVQRLFLKPNPTQADWDEVWTEWSRTPAEILAAARARLGISQVSTVPVVTGPVPNIVPPVAP